MTLLVSLVGHVMKKIVWKNKSNGQLCVTIPSGSSIKEGDVIDVSKSVIKRIAYIGVVADLFHYGHLQSIQFAQSVSDYVVVGVFTDKAVTNLTERKSVIASLNCTDKVMVQHREILLRI